MVKISPSKHTLGGRTGAVYLICRGSLGVLGLSSRCLHHLSPSIRASACCLELSDQELSVRGRVSMCGCVRLNLFGLVLVHSLCRVFGLGAWVSAGMCRVRARVGLLLALFCTISWACFWDWGMSVFGIEHTGNPEHARCEKGMSPQVMPASSPGMRPKQGRS